SKSCLQSVVEAARDRNHGGLSRIVGIAFLAVKRQCVVPASSSRDTRAHFCKRTEWATLLARERYPDYRGAPPQCRRMASDEACTRSCSRAAASPSLNMSREQHQDEIEPMRSSSSAAIWSRPADDSTSSSTDG